MNYIEKTLARQEELLRALSYLGSARFQPREEGEEVPAPAEELWELAETEKTGELSLLGAAEGMSAVRARRGATRPSAKKERAGRAAEETGAAEPAWQGETREEGAAVLLGARALSRCCEQDARRYDGAFPLY